MRTEFSCGNLRERGYLYKSDVDGSIILKLIFKKWVGGMDWNYLAQDRNTWRALVKAVLQLCVT